MADNTGQESALDTDSGKRPDLSSPRRCQSGSKAPQMWPPASDALREWGQFSLICTLAYANHALFPYEVDTLLGLRCSWSGRKSLLLALRTRGLVTDEQVERAFAQHPELRSA